MKRNFYIGAAFLTLLVALGIAQIALEKQADAQAKAAVMAPRFEVDPFWPKPLPNQWHIGQTIGVGVDPQDHVWIIHRVDSLSESEVGSEGAKAPPVLAFDAAGNTIASWGGPDPQKRYEWPNSNHGITVDPKGNVWIGGNGGGDAHILKFTQAGQFIAQFGHANPPCLPPTGTGCSSNGVWTKQYLPQLLGNYAVTTIKQAADVWFVMNCSNTGSDSSSTSTQRNNALGCLGGHLLATKLNLANGSPATACILQAVADADALLIAVSYNGPGNYSLSVAQRNLAIAIKNKLDKYNNGGGCP